MELIATKSQVKIFIIKHLAKSGDEFPTARKQTLYAHVPSGLVQTGMMETVYDISIKKLVDTYQWVMGRYTTTVVVLGALLELGYKIVDGLPINKTGVYATWKVKPNMGVLAL